MSDRRARIRAATEAEIKEAALAQIARDGAAALSIRAVARDVGMSPAGLYRYYDGRDALLTELLTDAYEDLADVVAAATTIAGTPADQFRSGARAYRRWAVEYPNRFLLIFGTPVPGYAAPEGGPTVAANRRMGQAFFEVMVRAFAGGSVVPDPDWTPLGTDAESELADQLAHAAPGFPAGGIPVMLGMWAHWHGMVILEVTNQWHWIYPDPGPFYEAELDRMVASLGL